MASAAVQQAPGNTFGQVIEPLSHETTKPIKHNVDTELFYHLDDGKPIAPAYIG